MGFFSKKQKIGFNELLDIVILLTLNSWEESQKLYKIFLKNLGESDVIDNRKKTEILIFEMLASTVAIKKTINSELLLDTFHNMVGDKVSNQELTKDYFKKLLAERYAVYQKILMEGGNFMTFSMGKQFADYFLDKDCEDMALINFSGESFFTTIKMNSEFLENIVKDYEISK